MIARHRIRSLMTASAIAATTMFVLASGTAQAASPSLKLRILSSPTHFAPGATFADEYVQYSLFVTNVGTAPSSGPITLTDTLPAGVTPVFARYLGLLDGSPGCSIASQTVTCVQLAVLQPGENLRIQIGVNIGSGLAEGATVIDSAAVSGGGAPAAQASAANTVSATSAPFEVLQGAGGLAGAFTDADGDPVTQAGAHPAQLTVDLGFSTYLAGGGLRVGLHGAGGGLRDLRTDLPRGVIVDPGATSVRCTEAQLEADLNELGHGQDFGCPNASQIGIVYVATSLTGQEIAFDPEPLYNMVPPPGTPAEFGFDAVGVGVYVHLTGGVRAGDYALSATSNDILARDANPIFGIQAQLWGDPSSSAYNHVRGACGTSFGPADDRCPVTPARTPLLTMPTACSDSLIFDASADAWGDPGNFHDAHAEVIDANGDPVPVSGCSALDFSPQISLQPTTHTVDSASGMDVDLHVPQTTGLNTNAEANLKKAVVTLPQGMALNPSAADGLAGCTEAQIGLVSESPARFDAADPACPDGSRVGTATVDTPLLPDPLQGVLYVAAQNDNPFHTLLAGYLVAQGSGVTIKLAGRFDLDPVTGQITATFDDNPQLPFSDLRLHFKNGDRGVLATPPTCGTFSSRSSLTSWASDVPVALDSPFSVDQGCDLAGRFEPTFSAGTVRPAAAAKTSFVMNLSRPAGQQTLEGVDVSLPPGLLAQVGSVPLCPEAQAAAGSCDAASRIGDVQVSAGAGATPLQVPQAGKAPTAVYLAGPYKGAPYSLSVVVPAQAGPFDLGTVVVRVAIFVDPIDAHVTAKSDPLPTILQGIPLDTREVRVTLDRSDFILNPSSCDPMRIAATITSNQGAGVDVSSPFRTTACEALDLKPKLDIALTGKGQTTDDKHPGVHATVSQSAGQANLKKVVVSLPLSLALDPDNAQALCEFTDGSKIDPTCPKGSIVGHAVARTPILDQPLTGPVYFVKNVRIDAKSGRQIRTLPKLVIPLTGENGLRLNLVGTSNVVDNHLVSTFDNIPDAPVSDFTLDIDGGKSGILVVSGTDICKSTQVADQQIDGQNGKTADANVYLQTPACPLKVLSKKVGKTSVAVKIGGLSAGKVTVTGKGIKKTTKTIAKSTVATITAKRTKGKPGKVTVSFDPTGPAKARKTSR